MKKLTTRLFVVLCMMVIINITLLFFMFMKPSELQKFKEIDVERINIVEADGTLKIALFNSNRLRKGLDGDKRQGTGTISGMFFYNEEGYETGGLVFDGKKIESGQYAGSGLMFDGYRQDQTIALQHNERKDSTGSYYEDGLKIMSRPDVSDVKEEYEYYALKYPEIFGDENTPRLSKAKIDSIEFELSKYNKVAQRRLFLGSKRGDRGEGWFDESGLYIKNKYGKDMIRIYVDKNNIPKFEVMDTLGEIVRYNLIPE
ncbi:hypothetical protein GTQ40_07350 [Flavobacteriaceae bacterium R38]|nr:hypothetical protein [Flavobacteriaceae bacterium R38]